MVLQGKYCGSERSKQQSMFVSKALGVDASKRRQGCESEDEEKEAKYGREPWLSRLRMVHGSWTLNLKFFVWTWGQL